jgi:hypothetical protein
MSAEASDNADVGVQSVEAPARPRSPAPRWLSATFVATLLTLIAEVVYVFFVHYRHLVHSDGACFVLMAKGALESRLPVPDHWYWGNGDVWLFAPILAALPVALLGVGLESLRFSSIFTFALELGVITLCFRTVSRNKWLSFFAAVVTLLGVSRLHLLFVYAELAYGFIATTCLAVFALLVRAIPVDEEAPLSMGRLFANRRPWLGAISSMVLVALSNPVRFLIFALAPLLVVCVWPWREIRGRVRVALAGVALGSWTIAFLVYRTVFERFLTFTPHRGHTGFLVKDVAGIAQNLDRLGHGVLALTGEPGHLSLGALPGLLFVVGGIVLVIAEVLTSRALTRERVLGLLLLMQLGAIVGAAIFGSLLLDPFSTRYVMPAVLPLMGMAVLAAHRRVSKSGREKWVGVGWLVLVPVMGALGFTRMLGARLEVENEQWSNRAGHPAVAQELARRNLRHGFSSYWNANLVTLFSNGTAKTCPVFTDDNGLWPQKWNVDTHCFDPAALPSKIYVLAAAEERAAFQRALKTSFPEPLERFVVGREHDGTDFEVFVFDTANVRKTWLELPLPEKLKFPLRFPATHALIRRHHGEISGDQVIATGEVAAIVYGPYLELPKGKYRIVWTGSGVDSPGQIAFDAFAERTLAFDRSPSHALAQRQHASLTTLHIELARDTSHVEFRVFSEDGGRVALEELLIEQE